MFYTRKGKLKNFGVRFVKATGKSYLIFSKLTKDENIHLSKVLREHDNKHNKRMIKEMINDVLEGKPKLKNEALKKLENDILNRVLSDL